MNNTSGSAAIRSSAPTFSEFSAPSFSSAPSVSGIFPPSVSVPYTRKESPSSSRTATDNGSVPSTCSFTLSISPFIWSTISSALSSQSKILPRFRISSYSSSIVRGNSEAGPFAALFRDMYVFTSLSCQKLTSESQSSLKEEYHAAIKSGSIATTSSLDGLVSIYWILSNSSFKSSRTSPSRPQAATILSPRPSARSSSILEFAYANTFSGAFSKVISTGSFS